jgi:tetratricopeptide (TPR) repeat protein
MNAKNTCARWVLVAFLCLLTATALLAGCQKKGVQPAATAQYQEAIQAAKQWRGPVHPVAGKAYEQGLEAYRAADWDRAADLLGQSVQVGVTNFPMRPDAMIYQADALQKGGHFLDSATVARQAAEQYPRRWEPRVILAEYWLWRENYANAQQQLAAAARVAPRQPEVLGSLARVQWRQGSFIAAVETARAAVMAKPGDTDFIALLGDTLIAVAKFLEHEGDYDAALTNLFIARSVLPADPRPPLIISRILLIRNNRAATRRYIDEGLGHLPEGEPIPLGIFTFRTTESGGDTYEYLRMGEFYLGREQPENAAQQFEQALALDPTNAEAWSKLGLVQLVGMGDPLAARECLHALWLLDPSGEQAAALEAKLSFADQSPTVASPGFVKLATVAEERLVKGAPTEPIELPAGARLFFNLTLSKAVGAFPVTWEVIGPNGQTAARQEWTMEFFGDDQTIVTTGAWNTPGSYEITWSTAGAVRAKLSFFLK